jgi:hypothetical protein
MNQLRDQPHTIWWWVEDGDPIPAPRSAQFDNADDAEEAAHKFIDGRNDPDNRLRWIKVFRSDNEQYETFHWRNPVEFVDPTPEPEPAPVLGVRKPRWRRWF